MVLKIFKMKRGTKVGWLLVAFAILLSLWVIISQSAKADTTDEGLILDETGTIVTGYSGQGGDILAQYFPKEVTTIDNRAFAGSNITSVALPSTVNTIGEEAFSGCGELANISFSTTGITTIPTRAFANCNKLTSVSLPANVSTISAEAFLNCGALQSCVLPATVNMVDTEAFKGCGSLTKYEVAEDNGSYMAYNGNIYDRSGNVLLRVAPGISKFETGDIYSGCKNIGMGAFSANQWIAEYTVPSQIENIMINAFKGSRIKALTVSSASTQFEGLENPGIELQEDWTMLTDIYGQSDSPAEMFSVRHNGGITVTFHAVGNTPDQGDVEDPENPTPAPSPTPGTNGQGGINGDANSGTIVNNNITGGAGGSSTVTNGGGSAYTVNGKDATPKTADGDLDIRWFAILGMFMAGLSIVFFSRFKKTEYIVSKENDSNDLDF